MEDLVVVLVTAPEAEAPKLAKALVERRLAACVNVQPTVRSFYRWDGRVHDDAESLLIIKSTKAEFAALRDAVVQLHSYDVPEIIALPIVEGSDAYCNWIRDNVGAPR